MLMKAGCSGGLARAGGEPFACPPLGLGDFARGHLVGDFRAAEGCLLMPADGGEIEPLVRLDQVAGGAMAAGGISDSKVEVGGNVALRRSGKAVGDQQVFGFEVSLGSRSECRVRDPGSLHLPDTPVFEPDGLIRQGHAAARMVNKWLMLCVKV